MRRWLALLVGFTGLAIGTPAHADANELVLRWSAPKGCPSTEDVRSATLENKGARGPRSDTLEADASVEKMEGRGSFRVRLRTKRGATIGERDIEATTCRGVAEATAVVLALALTPENAAPSLMAPTPSVSAVVDGSETATREREGEQRAAAAPTTSPPAASAVAREERPYATRPLHRETWFAVGASIASDFSTLFAPGLGGAASIAFTPGRFRLEVEGRRLANQTATLGSSPAGAALTMMTGGGRACWAIVHTRRIEGSPCFGADVVFLEAAGFGADANFQPSATWVNLTGGAAVALRLSSRFSLRANVMTFAPLSRPTFVVENEGPLHRPPILGASASLGVEVHFL